MSHVCARGLEGRLNQWPGCHKLCLHSGHPQKGPSLSDSRGASEGFTAASATGRWSSGTQGGSGFTHTFMGPDQSMAPCSPPPGAWKLPLRAASPYYLQPHSQEAKQNKGRDGGGGWMSSVSTTLPPTPLNETLVVWRRQEMSGLMVVGFQAGGEV